MTGYEFLAEQKARERGLDPLFVNRLIKQESAWNPNAVSPVGARGLMQIMPATGRDLGLMTTGQLLDPEQNIDAGTRYLSQLSNRFGGNPYLTAAAYNAGPGRVSRLMSAHGPTPEAIFPHLPAETRNYVTKVAGPVSAHQPGSPRTLYNMARGYVRPGVVNYQTDLTPTEREGFNKAVAGGLFGDIPVAEINNPNADYDYRGFYKAYAAGDPRATSAIDPQDKRLHFPDIWKTPAHESFSNESQYATALAPRWIGDQLVPSRVPSLSQSQPQSTLETLYNYVFGTENEGLPEAKMWPGPEVGEPPDQITTGDLATLGLLAMSGMGAALPTTVSRALPAMLQTSPARAIGNIALGQGGSMAGREVGEAVAGETGGNIGAGIGGLLSLPTKRPPVVKSDIFSIPAEGPLAGTKVLTREGLARPTLHGTGAAYEDVELRPRKTDEYLAYGPGYYATTNPQVTKEYSGVPHASLQKLVQKSEQKAAQEQKNALIARVRFRQTLTPEEQTAFDAIDWKNSRWETQARDVLAPAFQRLGVDEMTPLPTNTSSESFKFLSKYRKLLGTHNMASAFAREADYLKGKARDTAKDPIFPNTRPAYLNIKRPLDMDRPVSKKDIQDVMTALTRRKMNSAPGQADWEYSGQIAKSLGQRRKSLMVGDDIHEELRSVYGATEANKILQEAGFDGISHIGHGPFAGSIRTDDVTDPRKNRVWIAFREDQILPYFDPRFTKAQEKQKLEILKRSIKALKEQNALLKGEAITTEANPRGFAQNPYIPAGVRP